MGAAHLRGSLGIGTTGSPVPHSSLDPGHATCMPDADGIVSRLRPDCSQRSLNSPVLTSSVFAFDTSSVVRLCSSPWIHTCPVFPGLFLTRSRHRLLTDAAGGGLVPAPASRYRGTYPHLECSTKHSPSSACSRHNQSENFLAEHMLIAFAKPGGLLLPDGELMTYFWCTAQGVTHTRWVRLRVED